MALPAAFGSLRALEEFGAPFAVAGDDLIEQYGVANPEPPKALTTADLIRADIEANNAAVDELARAYGGSGQSDFPLDLDLLAERLDQPLPPEGSPEAVFAEHAKDSVTERRLPPTRRSRRKTT